MRRFLILPLLGACDVTGPGLPAGAEVFSPPAVYQQWWNLTEGCSGLTGNLSDVTWYRVPARELIPLGDGTLVNGRWDPVENRIILAGDSDREGDFVRHEMLHALLHTPDHPRSAFIGRCAGVVVCIERCITDGGAAPSPEPTAQIVSPATLTIGVEVTPDSPSSGLNDGHFMMVVTATNPSMTPVIVNLPPSGDAGPSGSFSYNIEGTGGGRSYDMRAYAPEVTRFGPSEAKRFIFDFHVGNGPTRYDQPPGLFRFGGAYGGNWASNAPTITVLP